MTLRYYFAVGVTFTSYWSAWRTSPELLIRLRLSNLLIPFWRWSGNNQLIRRVVGRSTTSEEEKRWKKSSDRITFFVQPVDLSLWTPSSNQDNVAVIWRSIKQVRHTTCFLFKVFSPLQKIIFVLSLATTQIACCAHETFNVSQTNYRRLI